MLEIKRKNIFNFFKLEKVTDTEHILNQRKHKLELVRSNA